MMLIESDDATSRHKILRDCDECCESQEKLIVVESFEGTVRLCEFCIKEALDILTAK